MSYKWQDEKRNEWVRRFCEDLRTKHGVDAQLDVYEVEYGESFSDYMTSRINYDCEAMLFVITPAAVEAVDQSKTGGVHFEMQIASARRMREPAFRMIGIYREGKNSTAYLRDHRYIDFRDDSKYQERLKELADSLWHRSHRPVLVPPGDDEVTAAARAPDFAAIQQDLLATDGFVVRAATEQVKEQGPEAVEAHASALRDRLADKSADRRGGAAYTLGLLGDERAVDPLIAALKDEDAVVRVAAARALGRIGDERAVDPLIGALQDEDEIVREAAAWALGSIGDEQAVEPLIAALQDEDERTFVRVAAGETLGLIGDEQAVAALIAVLQDEEPPVQRVAAYALGRIEDTSAVPDLIALLNDTSREPHVRSEVADALGKIKHQQAVDPLLAVLQNREEDAIVRRGAAHALGMIGDERAVRPLISVMQDPEEPRPVRDGACGALEMIGTPEALEAAREYRGETTGG